MTHARHAAADEHEIEQNRPTRIELYDGKFFDYMDPDPALIQPATVATVLARIPRFAAQTILPYSVGQHSLLVLHLIRERDAIEDPYVQMAALCHDAPEMVYGDLPTPLKYVLGSAYYEMAHKVDAAFAKALRYDQALVGLKRKLPTSLRIADRVAMLAEAQKLMPSKGVGWFGAEMESKTITWEDAVQGMHPDLQEPRALGHYDVLDHWLEEHDRILSRIDVEETHLSAIDAVINQPARPNPGEMDYEPTPAPVKVADLSVGDEIYFGWSFHKIHAIVELPRQEDIEARRTFDFGEDGITTFERGRTVLAIVRT